VRESEVRRQFFSTPNVQQQQVSLEEYQQQQQQQQHVSLEKYHYI